MPGRENRCTCADEPIRGVGEVFGCNMPTMAPQIASGQCQWDHVKQRKSEARLGDDVGSFICTRACRTAGWTGLFFA